MSSVPQGLTDPVCGMDVSVDSEHSSHYQGRSYFFCSEHCLHKFEHDPAAYVPSLKDPVCGMDVTTDSVHQAEHEGNTFYFCSEHCQHKFQQQPEDYVHGAADEIEGPGCDDASCSIDTMEYTCPMHPEILQDHPGTQDGHPGRG